MPLPRSTIPAGPVNLALTINPVLPPVGRRGRHQQYAFRDSITQLWHPLPTLHVVRHRTRMQGSLPAGGSPLPEGSRTPWTPMTGFRLLHLTSSSPRFILALRPLQRVVGPRRAMGSVLPCSDIRRRARVGRPITGHRMISSALSRSDSGIVMPSVFATLRLMIRLNLLGCSMGRSPGLAPFRILSTYSAPRLHISR